MLAVAVELDLLAGFLAVLAAVLAVRAGTVDLARTRGVGALLCRHALTSRRAVCKSSARTDG
jgi:hypothetical protein